MSFVNWVIDNLASEDVIDLYFTLTNLVDVNMTESEISEEAYYSALASHQTNQSGGDDSNNIPIGKKVF